MYEYVYIVVFWGGDLFLNLLGGCFVYDAEPKMSIHVAGSVRPGKFHGR